MAIGFSSSELALEKAAEISNKFGGKEVDVLTRTCHPSVAANEEAVYAIPGIGSFVRAYRAKRVPVRYVDYLYVKNGGLAFKVNEESQSFADAMTKIPPFWVDEVTKNKLADLNDVQTLADYSTFIH